MEEEKERYFGSIKFFKNLIFVVVLILIIVPTIFAVCNGVKATRSAEMREVQDQQISELKTELAQTQQQLDALNEQVAKEPVPGKPPEGDAEKNDAADAPYYESLYPDFYAPQPLNAETRAENTIYLTFDDGPSERTRDILKILAEQDVKATFFVVGKTDETSRELMREIVNQGHTLAMHSYTHNYTKIYQSVEAYLEDMYELFVLIRDTTGVAPTAFRFPGGSVNAYNTGINQQLISEMLRRGFTPFDWNLSAQDATSIPLSTEQVIENTLTGIQWVSRGVVLMHDSASRSSTVEALKTLIPQLREMGYEFDRIQPDTKPVLYSYRYYDKGN